MNFGLARIDVEIPAFNEWRVETPKNSTFTLKLESGTAEIFGSELSPDLTYVFKEEMKFAVATYHGCKISYTCTVPLDLEYISEETILKQMLNLHLAIENCSVGGKYPRILIIGPKDSGKTSLARTLAAYALKTSEKQPMLINLDPHLPHFGIASQLSVAKLYDSLDIETSTIAESLTTGPGTGLYRSQVPHLKCFGLEKFNENLELYKSLISELSVELDAKMKASKDCGTVIIDTPSFNVSDWKLIQQIVDIFHVDLLLVVGNERLLVDLRKKLTLESNVTMIKTPRSSGCIEKEAKYERDLQQRSIRQYFYGVERSRLNPFTFHSSVKDFIFLQPNTNEPNAEFLDFMAGDADDIVKTEAADDDYNPAMQSDSHLAVPIKRNWKYKQMLRYIEEPKEVDLINSVVAIIDDKDFNFNKWSKLEGDEKLTELNKFVTTQSVLGYSYVSSCDDTTGKIKLLVPSPVSSMPGKILIVTEMRYQE